VFIRGQAFGPRLHDRRQKLLSHVGLQAADPGSW
jgi:hypothetical protein